MTNTESQRTDSSELAQARLTNAQAIKIWFAQNEWPQKITDDWAREAGSEMGPWASQLCGYFKGSLNPKAGFFIALSDFNAAVAVQEFSNISTYKLKQRLIGSKPMQHDDGRVFAANDFWSMFAGLIEIPKAYRAASAKANGYVYLIRKRTQHKIGITTDLDRRLSELKPDAVVHTLELMGHHDSSPKEIESMLHTLFKDKRLMGTEYFDLSPSDVKQCVSLLKTFE